MKIFLLDKQERTQKTFNAIKAYLKKEGMKDLEKLGILLRGNIRRRVQDKGRDLRGGTMTYGSARYKKLREIGASMGTKARAAGYTGGFQTGFKDLTVTGRTWSSFLSERVSRTKVRLFFGNRKANDAMFGNNDRKAFFGLGSEEQKIIDISVRRMLEGVF